MMVCHTLHATEIKVRRDQNDSNLQWILDANHCSVTFTFDPQKTSSHSAIVQVHSTPLWKGIEEENTSLVSRISISASIQPHICIALFNRGKV
mmetsp:Transcript_31843/g.108073  ORF Transcript_31843/g.108073 Transcript_31843/m.108073 type:complete len:93 (+) Transcript_31843:991-1269(+)